MSKSANLEGDIRCHISNLDGGDGFVLSPIFRGNPGPIKYHMIKRGLTPPTVKDVTLLLHHILYSSNDTRLNICTLIENYLLFGFNGCLTFNQEETYIYDDTSFPSKTRVHRKLLFDNVLAGHSGVTKVPFTLNDFFDRPIENLQRNQVARALMKDDESLRKLQDVARSKIFYNNECFPILPPKNCSNISKGSENPPKPKSAPSPELE